MAEYFFSKNRMAEPLTITYFLKLYHFLNLYSNLRLRDLERGVRHSCGYPNQLVDLMNICNSYILYLMPAYFLPRSGPIIASQWPHLCSVTPWHFELPLANPMLWRRSMCTNSLVQFLIWNAHPSIHRETIDHGITVDAT